MHKHRHVISFVVTTLFYIFLFGGYFYLMTSYIVRDRQPQDSTIQLSLTQFVPQVQEVEEEVPVEEEVVEDEPEPASIVKEEPVVEELLPEPAKPKAVPLPVVKKTPPKKKVKHKKKKAKKKKVKKKKSKTRSAAATSRGVKHRGSGHVNVAEKNHFLAMVRQRINRNKSYPRIARRRGMQGAVKVHFTILRNGNVGSIRVSGPKVFHASAKSAVRKAFPISTKHAPMSLPATVNLTLRYQLR